MEFGFNSQIAKITHCADEAAFIHRIWYLTYNNEANERNFRDGKYWTYDSVQALLKIFDFWTPKQLRRIIRNCEECGLIETGSFAENPLDRRTWYALTDKAKEIYRNGQMHLPEWVNRDAQTGKSKCPNGQIVFNKEAIEDAIKDLRESAPAQNPKQGREAYGEFSNVLLTADEFGRLCAKWGAPKVRQEIEELSSYMASSGKRYKSHCATLSNWLRRKQANNSPARQDVRESKLEEW